MIRVLLKNRLLVLKNSLRTGSVKMVLSMVTIGIMALLFIGVSYTVAFGTSMDLKATGNMPLGEPLLIVGGMVSFIALLFLTVTVTITALYTSSDLSILLVAPLALRKVFTAKLTEIYLSNAVAVIVFGFPAMIAIGNVTGAGGLYYIMSFISTLLLALLPTGLGVVIVIFLMRVIPAYKAKEIMGALGAVFGIIIWVFTQIMRAPTGQPGPNPLAGQESKLTFLLDGLKTFWVEILPTTWLAKGVTQFLRGDFLAGLGNLAVVLIFSLILLFLALFLVEKFFYDGWVKIDEVRPAKKKKSTTGSKKESIIFNFIPDTIKAIVIKDLRLIQRNLQELVQLLWPLVMVVFMTWQITSMPDISKEDATMLNYFFLGLVLILIGAFNMRLSLGAFGRERDNFWIIISSNIPPRALLWGKFLVAYIPSALIAIAVLIVAALFGNVVKGHLLNDFLFILLISAAYIGPEMFFGVVYPKFDGKNPQQVVTFLGGIFSSLVNFLITAIAVGIYALMQYLKFSFFNSWFLDLLTFGLLGLMVFIITMVSFKLTADRLAKMEL